MVLLLWLDSAVHLIITGLGESIMLSPSFPESYRLIAAIMTPMSLSRYAIPFPSTEHAEAAVLFSTKKGSAVQVPPELLKDIDRGRLSREEQDSLLELGLVTHDPAQEELEMLSFINALNELNRTSRYTVVLNLDCNLGCRYCFEGTRKGKHYLSDGTAAQFLEFVRTTGLAGKKELKVTYYGGEPLLSVERIVSLSNVLGPLAKESGLEYGFTLVTNGTLLTPAVVERLKPLGLRSAKVTLDGPREVHDASRPFRSGAGSFDVILRNLRDVCTMTRIQLGGNYTQRNYRDFPRLLDILLHEGLTPDKLTIIRFDPVAPESAEFALPDFNDGCASSDEPWLAEATLFLREEVLRRGYHTPKITPSPCLMDLDASAIVNWDGSLYKCPGLIGRPQFRIGHVQNGIREYRQAHGLDSWKNPECLACKYLPLCFGGCRYQKLVRDGDVTGVDCRKRYFDAVLAGLVAQDIRYDL